MNKMYVIKIGGRVIDDDALLSEFLDQFVQIEEPKILVHGGGSQATAVARAMGIDVKMTNGRRITDADTLEIVTMVYGGLINKTLVAQIQKRGCNAIGLSGADGNIIRAHKRESHPVDYGHVGDIDQVHTDTLETFLDNGLTTVIAPLTHDGNGALLNTNADTIAAMIATAFTTKYEVELITCFEQAGVMESRDEMQSVLHELSYEYFTALKNAGHVTDGMIPKIETGFQALESGVSDVKICYAGSLLSVLQGTSRGRYTTFTRKKDRSYES